MDVGSRQYGRMPRGSNIIGTNPVKSYIITSDIQSQLMMGRFEPEYLYGNGTAGQQIAKMLAEIEMPSLQKRFRDG